MRPTQKVRQRRTFWVSKVELANSDEVATAEAFPVPSGEVAAEGVEERGAVVGADFAALLEFDNIMPDLPIGLEEFGIDGLESTATTGVVGLGNPIDQILVVGDGLEFRGHGGES